MKKTHASLLFLIVFGAGCLKDSDPPLPASNGSYINLYNFLTEAYDIAWEFNGTMVESEHSYGTAILEFIEMDEELQDVTITVKESKSALLIDSEVYELEQNRFYTASILGNEKDPHILFEPMEVQRPASGLVKLRFIHGTLGLDAVDLYVGGAEPEHKVVSALSFAQITDYLEASRENLWESIIVTPVNVSPEDSSILSYTANNVFLPNQIYLGVIGHATSSASSALQLQLYNQPVN
jgi:hypothetical protein